MALLRKHGQRRKSRNGVVTMMDEPVILEITFPDERVVFDPVRNANPFFHVMEFVWMMTGGRSIEWLEHFNSRMVEYCDPGTTHNHGAYGHRWLEHFKTDQLEYVIETLKADPDSRRAVMGMWDPAVDNDFHVDVPCNTHIYFNMNLHGYLDMTVCNRSNDIVWGMLGANIVHMTYLHELVAFAIGEQMGRYRVMTNNLHLYHNLPNFTELFNMGRAKNDPYMQDRVAAYPLMQPGEHWQDLLWDCRELLGLVGAAHFKTKWVRDVAHPIYQTYIARQQGDTKGENEWVQKIKATDWKEACIQWISRRNAAKASTSGDSILSLFS
jgi:hypothetical protein